MLMTDVSIFCYLTWYQAKEKYLLQKHLSLFYNKTSFELKTNLY